MNDEFMNEIVAMISEYWVHVNDAIAPFTIPEIQIAISGSELDEIAAKYIPDIYEPGSMMILMTANRADLEYTDFYDPLAMENFYDTSDVGFFIHGQRVGANFDQEIVTDDTSMPTLLDILTECYRQKTAEPVMKLS